jgi:hypothetical protein
MQFRKRNVGSNIFTVVLTHRKSYVWASDVKAMHEKQ